MDYFEKIVEIITSQSAFILFVAIIFCILGQVFFNFGYEILCAAFIILGIICGIGGIIRFFNEQNY